MDTFLWWSGVTLWVGLGLVGGIIVLDWCIDQAIKSFGFYRDVCAFIWDRARRKSQRIPGG